MIKAADHWKKIERCLFPKGQNMIKVNIFNKDKIETEAVSMDNCPIETMLACVLAKQLQDASNLNEFSHQF